MRTMFQKLGALLVVLGSVAGCTKVSRIFAGGGTEFIVQVDTRKPNLDEVVDLAAKIMRNRLNAAGIDGEASRISESPNRVSVKVFGDQDLGAIKRFLFTTHELELRKAVSPPSPSPLTTYPTMEAARAAAAAGQEVLRFQEQEYANERSSRFVIVESEPIITGEDVRYAQAVNYGAGENYSISFTLNEDGANKFGDWTNRNIDNYLAVVLDGTVVSSAYIKSQIRDMGQIDGSFTKASAEELALSLNSGHLPAKLSVLEERPFGN